MTCVSLLMRRASAPLLLAVFLLHGCVTPPQHPPEPSALSVRYESARWSQLPGWQADQAQEAWGAFLQSCKTRKSPTALLNACAAANSMVVSQPQQARTFFE